MTNRRRSAAAFAAIAGGVGLAWRWAFPTVRLPPADGPYAVGTFTSRWVVPGRVERLGRRPGGLREVGAQVWYPARPRVGDPRAPYVSDAALLAPLARLLGLPGFALRHLARVETNATVRSPCAEAAGCCPVLLFSHGRGGYPQQNTRLIESLASHGYIVVAIEHAHAAAGAMMSDGSVAAMDPRMADDTFVDLHVAYFAEDTRFVLDRLGALNEGDPTLRDRLDLDRVGVFGVSLGGAIAAEACRLDVRICACVVIDVWIPGDVLRDGLGCATMLLTRDVAFDRALRGEGARVLEGEPPFSEVTVEARP